MNIELLKQKLEITDNPGLDIIDPRFNNIITLAQNGDYLSAANGVEVVFEEGIYDIRIVGYFLYGFFLENDISGIASIFDCISYLFEENWEAIGPVKNRDKHAKTSLGWFLKQLLKKMQYEEKKEGDVWNVWINKTHSDDVQGVLDSLDKLRNITSVVLAESAVPVLDLLVKIKDWLSSLQKLVYVEPDIEPDVEEESESDLEEESDSEEEVIDEEKKIERHTDIPEYSHQFKVLIKKMQLFEQLIGDEKFARAALVSDDVNNIVGNFDPQIYFPQFFATFRKLYSINISNITKYGKYKKTTAWQAMLDFYKVDIDEFGNFSGNLLPTQGNFDEGNFDESNTDYTEHDDDDVDY